MIFRGAIHLTVEYKITKSNNGKTLWLCYNGEKKKKVVINDELTNFWRCLIVYSKGDKVPHEIREETGIKSLDVIRKTKYWLKDNELLGIGYKPTETIEKIAEEFIDLGKQYKMPEYMKPLQ